MPAAPRPARRGPVNRPPPPPARGRLREDARRPCMGRTRGAASAESGWRVCRGAAIVASMRTHVLPGAVGLCLCLVLTARAGAEVTAADFDVAADRVDAAADRLAAADFADVARPAATVLARRKPEFLPA